MEKITVVLSIVASTIKQEGKKVGPVCLPDSEFLRAQMKKIEGAGNNYEEKLRADSKLSSMRSTFRGMKVSENVLASLYSVTRTL